MIRSKLSLSSTALIAAAVLAGCGGALNGDADTRVDVLMSNSRAFQNIVFHNGSAYVSMSNTTTGGTAIVRTALPVRTASPWADVSLGNCALGTYGEHAPQRAPALRAMGDKLWMFQPWFDGPGAGAEEHALCVLNQSGASFIPQDQGLRACYEQYCYTLWMDELKLSGERMYTNAGAGLNLFVSDNQAASWRVLLGAFDAMTCYHQSFHIVGARLLVGGECPLDAAFIRAYQLSADGSRLESKAELPIDVPELENRNIQFITSVAGTQRVFAGVEGGLLRSDDGGKSFRFVIRHPVDGATSYPYVTSFLSPRDKPNVIVVAGFDKANAKPYLAWSADGGDKWTNLSAMLPGFGRAAADSESTAQVTSLAEDPQGRILLTLNEEETGKGKLMQLTLGKP